MTSAMRSARTVFSDGAAHHPSSPCFPRSALRARNVEAQRGAAHTLSRDR